MSSADSMFKTVRAILDKDGRLRLSEKVELTHERNVLVNFLEEDEQGASPRCSASKHLPRTGVARVNQWKTKHGSTFNRIRRCCSLSLSDISGSKVRPAPVRDQIRLADVDRSDYLLCQVTSRPYGDPPVIDLTILDITGELATNELPSSGNTGRDQHLRTSVWHPVFERKNGFD